MRVATAQRSMMFGFDDSQRPLLADIVAKAFLGGERKILEPLMRFVRGDVRDHIVSSKSTRDLHSGVEKRHSGGGVQRSTFARFFGSLDFRLSQKYRHFSDVLRQSSDVRC